MSNTIHLSIINGIDLIHLTKIIALNKAAHVYVGDPSMDLSDGTASGFKTLFYFTVDSESFDSFADSKVKDCLKNGDSFDIPLAVNSEGVRRVIFKKLEDNTFEECDLMCTCSCPELGREGTIPFQLVRQALQRCGSFD